MYVCVCVTVCEAKITELHVFSLWQSGVDDPNFAYDLLTELTRTFLAYADDVRAQDSAAYAIQVRNSFNYLCLFLYCIYLFLRGYVEMFVCIGDFISTVGTAFHI